MTAISVATFLVIDGLVSHVIASAGRPRGVVLFERGVEFFDPPVPLPGLVGPGVSEVSEET